MGLAPDPPRHPASRRLEFGDACPALAIAAGVVPDLRIDGLGPWSNQSQGTTQAPAKVPGRHRDCCVAHNLQGGERLDNLYRSVPMTGRHDETGFRAHRRAQPGRHRGRRATPVPCRCVSYPITERQDNMESIVTLVVVVLIVLFILGYFGRGRIRG